MKKQESEFELNIESIPRNIIESISQESITHYKFIPLYYKDSIIFFGAIDSKNIDMIDAMNFLVSQGGYNYKIIEVDQDQFNLALRQYAEKSDTISKMLEEIESQTNEYGIKKSESDKKIESEGDKNTDLKDDAPIIKFIDSMLKKAIEIKASDIHIEPWRKDLVVRFRIDGTLGEVYRVDKKLHSPTIARIKILSSLRLDERRKPQDGRFSIQYNDIIIDFRVATFPTSEGEKVILRILHKEENILTLNGLGFLQHHQDIINRAIKKPYGMILSTGPTGSGKTTTLYTLLKLLDSEKQNIVSLEDPVEYSMEGVNQSEVHPEIGYTFASGLRSILRGDPNVILVGEIRDKETAQLAVQSALTGHLVFSTLHTNSAIGAIPRLIDFGIDPFLLAPTLNIILGQRLAKRICKGAEDPVEISPTMKKNINAQISDIPAEKRKIMPELTSFYNTKATKECPDGIKGRTGVYEMLDITPEISKIILDGGDTVKIRKEARKNGMFSLQEDAIIKCLNKQVPFYEVNKISNESILGEKEEKTTNENLRTQPISSSSDFEGDSNI